MLPNVFHTIALTKIRRIRKIYGRGEILVRVGQKLTANDKVADLFVENKYQTLNIKKLLNLNSSQDARRSIELEEGKRLKAGDLIAEASGVMKKSVKAEFDSEVVLINGSLVLLQVNQKPQPLLAGFDCIVSEILPNYGVVLETNGALIQGVWGNQKTNSGLLLTLAHKPDEELLPKMLEMDHRGAIIMGGYCRNVNVLKNAKDLPVKGMILSGMYPDLIPAALSAPFPIIVLGGFSPAPMNMRAFDLLKTSEKREISISAIYNPSENEKPEIIIPLAAEAELPIDSFEYKNGMVVRVNQGLYQGRAGVIRKIVNTTVMLFNGVKTICAVVQFSEDDQASIPLANLDIIE
jgi:hypothetical protein